jgi:hypothetical protein
MIEIVQYETAAGNCPFAAWFDDLDARTAAKVRTAIARIETGNLGDVKPVGEGVSERRIDFGWIPGLFRAGRAASRDPARGRDEEAPTARYRPGQGVLAGLQTP